MNDSSKSKVVGKLGVGFKLASSFRDDIVFTFFTEVPRIGNWPTENFDLQSASKRVLAAQTRKNLLAQAAALPSHLWNRL